MFNTFRDYEIAETLRKDGCNSAYAYNEIVRQYPKWNRDAQAHAQYVVNRIYHLPGTIADFVKHCKERGFDRTSILARLDSWTKEEHSLSDLWTMVSTAY